MYVMGGCNHGVNPERSVYVYDPQAGAWAQLSSMGTARRNQASAVVGGKLYVFGGYGAANVRLSTAEVYDLASGSWAQGPSLTPARESAVAAAL